MKYLLPLLFFSFSSASAFADSDTLRIYFGNDQSSLSMAAKKYLDSCAATSFFNAGDLFITGYADHPGGSNYNKTLSTKRAQNTERYLRKRLNERANIRSCKGEGSIESQDMNNRSGKPMNRIVTIVRQLPQPEQQPSNLSTVVLGKNENSGLVFRNIINPDSAPDGFVEYTERVNRQALASHKNLLDTIRTSGLEANTYNIGYEPQAQRMQAIRKIVAKKNNNQTSIYGTACIELAMCYAIKKQKDSTFYFLNKALSVCPASNPACSEVWLPNILGFYQFDDFKKTDDWELFEKKIISQFNKANRNSAPNSILPLIIAAGADQSVRFHLPVTDAQLPAKALLVHNKNILFIKSYIDKYGFPKISEFGQHVSEAAFLLVQHADDDQSFQKKVLDQIRLYLPTGDVNKSSFAFLQDRYLVNKSGYQLYGTQFKSRPDTETLEGAALYPVQDAPRMNIRRREMGLPPLDIKYMKRPVDY